MLSERSWQPDLVLRFLVAVLLSYMGGALLSVWLNSEFATIPLSRNYVLIIVGTISFHAFVLAVLPFLLRSHGMSFHVAFGFPGRRNARAILVGVLVGILGFPLVYSLGELSAMVEEYYRGEVVLQETVQMLQDDTSPLLRGLIFLAAVIVAPVAEEITFRGILYPTIKQAGFPRVALWSTSVIFAVVHANWVTLLPFTVLALLLVAVYEITDNLLSSIALHSIFNLANFVQLIWSVQN